MTATAVTKSTKPEAAHEGVSPTSHNTPECKLCLNCQIACWRASEGTERGLINATKSVMSSHCDRCRFLKYVNVTPTCWFWTGTSYAHRGKVTYGQFWLQDRRMGAHRASYLMHRGAIPVGLEVMHSCDVKACVRPEHLEVGTHRQNIADARTRGGEWSLYGENHGRARLTWAKVDAIRSAAAAGTKQADLAAQYGVTQVHISHIVRGERWNVRERVREAVPA